MKGHRGTTRERFPDVEAKIGEDPARFLDKPIFGDIGGSSPLLLAKARIRGIDDREAIPEWIRVEHELERGPREKVVELIQQRAQELAEIGSRDERCESGSRDVQDITTDWTWIIDGEEHDERPSSASARLSSMQSESSGGAEA